MLKEIKVPLVYVLCKGLSLELHLLVVLISPLQIPWLYVFVMELKSQFVFLQLSHLYPLCSSSSPSLLTSGIPPLLNKEIFKKPGQLAITVATNIFDSSTLYETVRKL